MPPRLPLRQTTSTFFQKCRNPSYTQAPRLLPLLPAVTVRNAHRRSRSGDDVPAPRQMLRPTGLRAQYVMDEAIPRDVINYVDVSGAFHPSTSLRQVLRSIDRHRYHVVCINPFVEEGPLICKCTPKEELADLERKAAQKEKEKRRERREKNPELTVKEVEFSWAISEHDLGHRMRRVREFMEKGFTVTVALGTKRGMKKMPKEEMEELVERVRGECAEWGKEVKEAEGRVGWRLLMVFEGRRTVRNENGGVNGVPPVRPVEEVNGMLVDGAKEVPVEEVLAGDANETLPVRGA